MQAGLDALHLRVGRAERVCGEGGVERGGVEPGRGVPHAPREPQVAEEGVL